MGNFDLVPYVVINKFDVNKMMTREIEKYCDHYGILVIGKVPFDQSMVKAMVEQKSVFEYAPSSKISKLVRNIWRSVNE